MQGAGLVDFPLPLLTALLCAVLAGLVWRLDLGVRRAARVLALFFAVCAVQAALVALRFGYGIEGVIPLQRALPLLLGPLLYLGFVALALAGADYRRVALTHLGAPLAVLLAIWLLAPDLRWLDLVISASYFVYASALIQLWRRSPDALILARVESAPRLSNWVLRAAGLLAFVFMLDTAIALDFALNGGANATLLISFGTIPLIGLLLATLVALPIMLGQAPLPAKAPLGPEAGDAAIEARLRALMERDQLFLDPELTVQRLAKRLHLPARALSAAINRSQGMNVSQYVNDFRLSYAAALLRDSDASVSRIAERSGFLTRSNFYREFQRVHGQTPTEYRNSGPRPDGVSSDGQVSKGQPS